MSNHEHQDDLQRVLAEWLTANGANEQRWNALTRRLPTIIRTRIICSGSMLFRSASLVSVAADQGFPIADLGRMMSRVEDEE